MPSAISWTLVPDSALVTGMAASSGDVCHGLRRPHPAAAGPRPMSSPRCGLADVCRVRLTFARGEAFAILRRADAELALERAPQSLFIAMASGGAHRFPWQLRFFPCAAGG